ncbi:hypothetical protein A2U01_0000322 [Trifolium medium]|uniref:Uncharacterized protein n=1 Tax=Trifolium medium TaxID=97028 RepID=A0A392LX85_9FABA|nr:hypothetical protein [Trifolium medium]
MLKIKDKDRNRKGTAGISQSAVLPLMKIHQHKRNTPGTPDEDYYMPHLSLCPSPHQSHPAAVGDVPGNPDSRYPEHGSGAPAVSYSVSENAQSGQSVGGYCW